MSFLKTFISELISLVNHHQDWGNKIAFELVWIKIIQDNFQNINAILIHFCFLTFIFLKINLAPKFYLPWIIRGVLTFSEKCSLFQNYWADNGIFLLHYCFRSFCKGETALINHNNAPSRSNCHLRTQNYSASDVATQTHSCLFMPLVSPIYYLSKFFPWKSYS